MAYEKLNLKNGQKLDEAHLAHMEEGIAGAALAGHTHTASDVGALPSNYVPPVMSVNSKTGAVTLSAADLKALDAIEDTTYPGCFYRMNGGTQEWINPPAVIGQEYRTTKRANGRVIYQQWFNTGGLVSNSDKTVNINANVLKRMYNLMFITFRGDMLMHYIAPAYNDSGSVILYVRVQNGNLIISCKTDLSNFYDSYCLIEYTKTWDF